MCYMPDIYRMFKRVQARARISEIFKRVQARSRISEIFKQIKFTREETYTKILLPLPCNAMHNMLEVLEMHTLLLKTSDICNLQD
jgi:hypothetical protein